MGTFKDGAIYLLSNFVPDIAQMALDLWSRHNAPNPVVVKKHLAMSNDRKFHEKMTPDALDRHIMAPEIVPYEHMTLILRYNYKKIFQRIQIRPSSPFTLFIIYK